MPRCSPSPTAAWFVVRLGAGSFGIFDAFADDDGRETHIHGRLAAAPLDRVGKTIEPPQIARIDVLAAVTDPRLGAQADGASWTGTAMHAPPVAGSGLPAGWASTGEPMQPPPS